MWKRLSDLAQVTTGYPFREKVLAEDEGDLAVLQIKDLGIDGHLDLAGALRIRGEAVHERHRLQANDILLQSRGVTNRAVVFEGTVRAIAALGLLVVRPLPEVIKPAFLYWFLNHPKTQARLQDLSRGSTVSFIAKTDVEDFPIPTPPIELQEQVITVDRVRRHEKRLTADLDRLRGEYIDNLMWQAAASEPTKRT